MVSARVLPGSSSRSEKSVESRRSSASSIPGRRRRRLRRGFLPNQARPAIGIMGPMGSGAHRLRRRMGRGNRLLGRLGWRRPPGRCLLPGRGFLGGRLPPGRCLLPNRCLRRRGLLPSRRPSHCNRLLPGGLLARGALGPRCGLGPSRRHRYHLPHRGRQPHSYHRGAVRCPEGGKGSGLSSSGTTASPIASRSGSPQRGPAHHPATASSGSGPSSHAVSRRR
jgi:hypothetical protein